MRPVNALLGARASLPASLAQPSSEGSRSCAHGGVGINYAIQDAVEAANLLGDKLKAGQLQSDDLEKAQRRREWPTRVIQWLQRQIQQRIIATALRSNAQLNLPLAIRLLLRLPLLRNLPARMIAFGVRRVHVKR
jgi:2-polyprenyl-6-methoxyphenol hydroxylase-like FAD-dependent oxidoreductase